MTKPLFLKQVLGDFHYLECAIIASIEGGKAILSIDDEWDGAITQKVDQTPLTKADLASHKAIVARLAKTQLPIVSEEGEDVDYQIRCKWEQFWLVDPLDGTKEFIKRNGQYAVNIGLVSNGSPKAGVVLAPAMGILYFGDENLGAFRVRLPARWRELEMSKLMSVLTVNCLMPEDELSQFTIVGSRSHSNAQTQSLIHTLLSVMGPAVHLIMGSALKICLVAEGTANLYPRMGTTMEWDTAAGHAILSKVGGTIVDVSSLLPITYNKERLQNPSFLCVDGSSLGKKVLKLLKEGEILSKLP
jgi:3'(2'), 5'-bisphosphate nucleotidase